MRGIVDAVAISSLPAEEGVARSVTEGVKKACASAHALLFIDISQKAVLLCQVIQARKIRAP